MTYNTYEEYFIHKETGDTSHPQTITVLGTWMALWRKQPDDILEATDDDLASEVGWILARFLNRKKILIFT